MNISPVDLLNRSIKAVPAVRYALGVVGLAAAVAIVAGFNIDYRVAVFGVVILIGLMFVLLIFSSIAGREAKKALWIPALVLAWAFLILIVVVSTFLVTSFFFSWPIDLGEYFATAQPVQKVSITIQGKITTLNKKPIGDADITIAATSFHTRSREDGSFLATLQGAKMGEIITVRVHHKDYGSRAVDRQISQSVEVFDIDLPGH